MAFLVMCVIDKILENVFLLSADHGREVHRIIS